MKFIRLIAAFTLILAIPATASHAADGKPAGESAKDSPPRNVQAPSNGEQAGEAKAVEPSPGNTASDGAEADPATTASTDAKAKPEPAAEADKPLSLTIASWGGAYAKSQELAFIDPFRDETGAQVKLVSHGGDLGGLMDSDSSTPAWDVVDLGQTALRKACEAGLLERIGADDIAAAGAEALAHDDFLPGGLQDCGVATMAWSAAIAFDKKAFGTEVPKIAADFFDVEKFPGNRAAPSDPKYLLPLALMGDGVAPGDVYETLESEEGVKRALAKLETIHNSIVWWRKADQPLKLIAKDYASMAVAFSGRIFYAIARDNRPIGVIWDGQVYDLDLWAVPKDAANREAALKFIAFSIQPERLAAQTKWFPYGPMRKSAVELVGRHAVVDVEMSEHVPTSDANFERALRLDPAWWVEHGERLTAAFESWMVTPAAPDASVEKIAADETGDADEDEKAE